MKKYLVLILFSLVWLACNSRDDRVHTFDEFEEAFNVDLVPMGTWFWDEFGEYETRYNLTQDESKVLGRWLNVTFHPGPDYNRYNFFPNRLFILRFNFNTFRVIDTEKTYFDKAVGTWELIDGIVRITIYAIIIEDKTLRHPFNKDVFLVEQPYTVDFININDIDRRGFTRRPINDTILSEELERKVIIQKPNRSNNLYVRNVYTINTMDGSKNYDYFIIVPEMARDNVSGYDVATSAELIRKYIRDWWF